jgi:hypothetical protein
MKDFDAAEVIPRALDFMEKSHAEGEPFFVWLNTSRMHLLPISMRSGGTPPRSTHMRTTEEHLKTLPRYPPVQGGTSFDLSNVVGEVLVKARMATAQ